MATLPHDPTWVNRRSQRGYVYVLGGKIINTSLASRCSASFSLKYPISKYAINTHTGRTSWCTRVPHQNSYTITKYEGRRGNIWVHFTIRLGFIHTVKFCQQRRWYQKNRRIKNVSCRIFNQISPIQVFAGQAWSSNIPTLPDGYVAIQSKTRNRLRKNRFETCRRIFRTWCSSINSAVRFIMRSYAILIGGNWVIGIRMFV